MDSRICLCALYEAPSGTAFGLRQLFTKQSFRTTLVGSYSWSGSRTLQPAAATVPHLSSDLSVGSLTSLRDIRSRYPAVQRNAAHTVALELV